MNEFMVLVERAVRPVQAGPKKKLRMREELLAHLMAIHEEELARLGDDSAARAEAIRRFGDPEALTVELQQSVKWSDRIDARLNRMYGWRPGESAARSSARLAGLVAVMIMCWMCFTLVATGVRRPHDATVPTSAQLVRLFGALAVCAPAAIFVMALLTVRIRDSIYGAFGAPRSWRRVVGLAGLSLVLFPVLGTAFSLVGLPDAGEMVKELTTTRSIVTSAVSYLFVALFLVWFAWKTGPGQIRHVEWASLDIGQ
jgi:hypothetical protein